MVNLRTKNWLLEDIDFVIFDKDGTFIDIHSYWGRVVELRARKIIQYFSLTDDFFEPLCEVMGYDIKTKKLPPDSPVGLYARGKVQEILLYFLIGKGVEAYLEDIESIFAEVNQEFVEEQEIYTNIIESSTDFMKKLKDKVQMAVVTSDSRQNAIYTIEKNGLKEYFKQIYGAENSKTAKTTGKIIKKLLKELKIKPEKTICIGDTYDDFLMAKNSGIKACINVSTGIVSLSEHQKYNEFCVNELNEIELFN